MDLRKIDSLVAEKVMGWRVAYFPTINIYEAYDEEENPIIIGKDFSPARKIQDAWMAAEKFESYNVHKNKYTSKYTVSLTSFTNRDIYGVPAKTASLAICLAALKSVGVEVEVDG